MKIPIGLMAVAAAAAPAVYCAEGGLDPKAIEAAAGRSVALLEKSAAIYIKERDCFSCHHQALPPLALSLARERGLAVDVKAWPAQSKFTRAFFQERREKLPKGQGVPGGSYTTAYALLAQAAQGVPADDLTAAMLEHLRKTQEPDGRWRMVSNRPPLEYTDFTSTALALRALQLFSRPETAEADGQRLAHTRKWLNTAKPVETEDRVWHLFGLKWTNAEAAAIDRASQALLAEQHTDGGWAQKAGLQSDPYATGQALVALHLAGGVSTQHSAWRRGLDWLLRAQKEDGSWQVKSRSKPFQKYFESGYPHGTNQFISICAGSWATMALVLTRPPVQGQPASPLATVVLPKGK